MHIDMFHYFPVYIKALRGYWVNLGSMHLHRRGAFRLYAHGSWRPPNKHQIESLFCGIVEVHELSHSIDVYCFILLPTLCRFILCPTVCRFLDTPC